FPSYAPNVAMAHFKKLECFCFTEHVLKPGESKQWPVVFVVDRKLPKDVRTITLSYTFFEVGGKTPAEPSALAAPALPSKVASGPRATRWRTPAGARRRSSERCSPSSGRSSACARARTSSAT